MPKTKLKDHLGTEIEVHDDGTFSAYIAAQSRELRRKDLRSIEREIEKAQPKPTNDWPGKLVARLDAGYNEPPTMTIIKVVGYRTEQRSRNYRESTQYTLIDDKGKDVAVWGHGLYEHDPEIVAEINAILAEQWNLETRKSALIGRLKGTSTLSVADEIKVWNARQSEARS